MMDGGPQERPSNCQTEEHDEEPFHARLRLILQHTFLPSEGGGYLRAKMYGPSRISALR
jgi:hypothetical protein